MIHIILVSLFRDLFGYDDVNWVEPVKQTLEYYKKLLIKNGNVFYLKELYYTMVI